MGEVPGLPPITAPTSLEIIYGDSLRKAELRIYRLPTHVSLDATCVQKTPDRQCASVG
jgi:hypothetical protein